MVRAFRSGILSAPALLENMTLKTSTLLRVAAFSVSTLALTAAGARANTIGPIGCANDSCQGATYTLTDLGQVSDLFTGDGLSDTWRIQLTIDPTGYNGSGVRIDDIAVKVSSDTDAASLVSAPGGVGVWTRVDGGLNANGCTGSGSGYECAAWKDASATGAFLNGTLLTWIFDIDVKGALLSGADLASIKVRFVDANGDKTGALVSEPITLGDPMTPVPEPGTLLLLGSGFTGFLARRRVRSRFPTA